ncbi:cupin domain-containing protein [Microvirga yunnanensis]|uniref:cupin domain-containing protein n=1 Tax=Microvirga yunnanensis TaxID=2953740 RepID=UPI0021C99ED0|nr:cupin domain-containing protein [Microvirga sp. HBU65207]
MHPTYTDLRASAPKATTPIAQNDPANRADSFARFRQSLAIDDPNLDVGWYLLPAGEGMSDDVSQHELLVVLAGEIDIEGKEGRASLQAGSSLIVPKGGSFRWSVADHAKLAFMRYRAEEGPSGADVIFVDPDVPLSPSGSPAAELLLSETPSCRNNTLYATPTRHWSAGVWDSTPYHRAPMVYAHYELMHILEGSVRITDDQGRATTFGPDSIFLVPKGAKCSWLSEEQVRKVWGILRVPS